MLLRTRCLALAAAVAGLATGCSPDTPESTAAETPDVTMTWVEKYLTYEQTPDDQLNLTDVHFLAEIIFDGDRNFDAISAAVHEADSSAPLATYGGRDKRAFTNGYFYTRKTRSFDALEDLENRHPPDATFVWTISGPAGDFRLDPIRIGGPNAETAIPDVSTIQLSQGGNRISDYDAIAADEPLTISWDPFTIGGPLEGTKWRDLVFVLVSDCKGDVVYTGGAPGTDDDFVDFTKTSTTMPAGRMKPGLPYVVFISQVNYVDFNVSHGIEQFAANSFATELGVRTAGTATTDTCEQGARPAQYLWTRKTRGEAMQSWPTVADSW